MRISSLMIFASALLLCSALLAQPIYKVVDEDGNVTFTDQKPDPGAEPIELPEVNVIGADSEEVEDLVAASADDDASEAFEIEISEPAHGSLIANEEGRIDLTITSNLDIPQAAELVVYINDRPQPAVQSSEISFTDLVPDEYRLRAELQTPSGRVLATTEEITTRLIAVDSR